jgi:hypothetical protein
VSEHIEYSSRLQESLEIQRTKMLESIRLGRILFKDDPEVLKKIRYRELDMIIIENWYARFRKTFVNPTLAWAERIKAKNEAYIERVNSIPKNATIRKEYIRCKKTSCSGDHKHGPYYYAYWKDPITRKLKKKCIGTHYERTEKAKCESENSKSK